MGSLASPFPLRIGGIAAALLLGVGAVRNSIPQFVPKNWGVVEPGFIYRSGELTPRALERVTREHGLRTIIDLGAYEPGTAGDRTLQKTSDALGLTRYVFDLEGDGTGNPNAYVLALRLMTDPANQPVLVHCGAGSERTGCAVMLYRHIVEGVPLDRALEEARGFRHDPARNPRLARVIDEWAAKIERAFNSGGQIPDAPALTDPPVPGAPTADRNRSRSAE